MNTPKILRDLSTAVMLVTTPACATSGAVQDATPAPPVAPVAPFELVKPPETQACADLDKRRKTLAGLMTEAAPKLSLSGDSAKVFVDMAEASDTLGERMGAAGCK